jgi:lysophospholipase L1-like esterase
MKEMMKKLLLVMLMTVSMNALSQRAYDTIPNLPEHYIQRLEKFKKEQPANGKILFLGNSITEGGNWRRLLKDSTVINRGIGGDNTFGVLRRLDEVIKHKPSKIFLLIGVNDLSKNVPNEVIIENIFSIVGKIRTASPRTTIYVQSLLPLNPVVKNFPVNYGGKQEHVLEINKQLLKYGEALKYTFVDLHAAFLDKNNLLDARYTYDGLHLNASGYVHWVEYLKKEKFL